jgi:hypothetical protein
MQYILTEEEYTSLINKIDEQKRMPSKKELQKFCTKIADEMPIKVKWVQGDPQPWQCILTVDYEWYCDECPAKSVCPYEHKSHSK